MCVWGICAAEELTRLLCLKICFRFCSATKKVEGMLMISDIKKVVFFSFFFFLKPQHIFQNHKCLHHSAFSSPVNSVERFLYKCPFPPVKWAGRWGHVTEVSWLLCDPHDGWKLRMISGSSALRDVRFVRCLHVFRERSRTYLLTLQDSERWSFF